MSIMMKSVTIVFFLLASSELLASAVLEKFEGHKPKICFIGLETDSFPRRENIILTLA